MIRSLSPILTARERDVLALLCQGLTNKEIAARLGTSAFTVKHQLSDIYWRMGVKRRGEAVVAAMPRIRAIDG